MSATETRDAVAVREDLVAIADGLAVEGRRLLACIDPEKREDLDVVQIGDVHLRPVAGQVAEMAHGAKSALEAAALVEPDVAPILGALQRLEQSLGVDVMAVVKEHGPAVAIDAVANLVVETERLVEGTRGESRGYEVLRSTMESLLLEFRAAQTETAHRIASRIDGSLTEAREAIEAAKGGGEDG